MESMLTWALNVQIQKLLAKFYLCIKITKSLTKLYYTEILNTIFYAVPIFKGGFWETDEGIKKSHKT